MRRQHVLVVTVIAAGLIGVGTVPSAAAMESSAPRSADEDADGAGGFSANSVVRSWLRLRAAGQGPVEAGDADMTSQAPGWDAVDPATLTDVGADDVGDVPADDAGDVPEWVWPAEGDVTSEFGQRWGRLHEGFDLANAVGTPILAATDGEVRFARAESGYGLTVKIDHGDEVETTYSHLSAVEVAPGDTVTAGDRIGAMGCTGSCTGPHVHVEVRRSGTPMDPRTVLP